MKYITFVLVALVVLWGVMNLGATEYYEPTYIEEEALDVPQLPEEWLKEAEEAKQRVLEKKQLEHERETLQLQRDVLEVQSKNLEEQIKEIDKTLGVYWLDRDNIVAYIREMFPEAPRTAVAVAYAESGMRMVQSDHMQPYGREESFGLFQIHAKAWEAEAKRVGLTNYKTDIEQNIKMARHVYEQAGNSFSPWSVYKNGSYMVAMR